MKFKTTIELEVEITAYTPYERGDLNNPPADEDIEWQLTQETLNEITTEAYKALEEASKQADYERCVARNRLST